LAAVIENKSPPQPGSERIIDNFRFFEEQLKEADLTKVYRGILKLVVVDVHLTRGQDDPQMIFESLNSTGLELTQADLIRNFVLMRQDEELQTRLYESYWRPIEAAFGPKYRTEFDKFIRDFLTIKLKPSKQLKSDEIYRQFRGFFQGIPADQTTDVVLREIKRFGIYYAAFSLGQEENEKLRESLRRLRGLVEVASPLILQLYDYYARAKTLTLDGFLEAAMLIESYVFRRAVSDMQTRSLYQIFASLAYRIDESDPLLSLKVALYRQSKKRRFPLDVEFREALETRDVYDMRTCFYLLDRLENDSKERVDTSTLTIEHVLPQNEELRPEWKEMLGKDWRAVQEAWQHRLGNLTLTGYNPEYSDLPFEKKKVLVDKEGRQVGFNFSPLRLNKFIGEQSVWTQLEIERRGKELANRAVSIWPSLNVDVSSVRASELEELRKNAAGFSFDDLEFGPGTRTLFDELRRQILVLGDDIVELPGQNTVTYRVFDFFAEIIPRRRRLTLVLNLDFEEADDPTGRATDTTERAFVVHATQQGGVLFRVEGSEHVGAAIHLIRQAYEKVSE
jgi:predicted transport protein